MSSNIGIIMALVLIQNLSCCKWAAQRQDKTYFLLHSAHLAKSLQFQRGKQFCDIVGVHDVVKMESDFSTDAQMYLILILLMYQYCSVGQKKSGELWKCWLEVQFFKRPRSPKQAKVWNEHHSLKQMQDFHSNRGT